MKIKFEILTDLFKQDRTQKEKICISASIGWILFIGYLTWINSLKDILNKGYKWDEWFWFGIIPAIAPYVFYFFWKKKDQDTEIPK